MSQHHVLIPGATGVGRAAVEHFAGRSGQVTATSRRRPFETYGAWFCPGDLTDPSACRTAFTDAGIIHVVFAALHDEKRLVDGCTDPAHLEVKRRLSVNLAEAIDGGVLRLGAVSIVQETEGLS